jgi:hypothetical protein
MEDAVETVRRAEAQDGTRAKWTGTNEAYETHDAE